MKLLKNKVVIFAVVIVASLWVVCIAVIGIFYDGGIPCFFDPIGCKHNASALSGLPTAFPTVTPAPSLRRTLVATPKQFLTPTLLVTPTATEVPQIMPVSRSEPENLNCGHNPYVYNDVSHSWERKFSVWCYPHTNNDPFERIFWGMEYGQVVSALDAAGLSGLSRQEQLVGLAKLGYWDFSCNCVP